VQVLFTKSLKIVLVVLAVLIAIRSVGIDLTALAVVGGAIGLGIGFGFQKTVSNLVSGVILLIDKSIKPGDVIAVAGTYGWVTTLGGRYVSVVTRDGVEHLIERDVDLRARGELDAHAQPDAAKARRRRPSQLRLETGDRDLRRGGEGDRARAEGAGAEVPVHRIR
jgi:hypothetical protein